MISIKVALEMLKQYYFFVDRFWVIKEIQILNFVFSTNASPLDVIEMEVIRVQYDFCGIIKKNSVRSIGEFVTHTIF